MISRRILAKGHKRRNNACQRPALVLTHRNSAGGELGPQRVVVGDPPGQVDLVAGGEEQGDEVEPARPAAVGQRQLRHPAGAGEQAIWS